MRARAAKAEERAPIPAELRQRARWVRHTAAKVPLVATSGRAASSTDPSTWRAYSSAASSEHGVGLGFVLTAVDELVCVDLDHCLSRGVLAPWARQMLDAMPATYVEISPSGTGLHIWGRGRIARGRRLWAGDRCIEVYGTGRYITITGRPFGDAPSRLADIGGPLRDLLGVEISGAA